MPRASKDAVERVKVDKLRTLGAERKKSGPAATPASAAMRARARTTMKHEFERVMTLQQKLAAESAIGGTEKGRAADRAGEKLRGLVASLEGMNRFALQMGLITPAESREMYAEAMKRGLHQGWK